MLTSFLSNHHILANSGAVYHPFYNEEYYWLFSLILIGIAIIAEILWFIVLKRTWKLKTISWDDIAISVTIANIVTFLVGIMIVEILDLHRDIIESFNQNPQNALFLYLLTVLYEWLIFIVYFNKKGLTNGTLLKLTLYLNAISYAIFIVITTPYIVS